MDTPMFEMASASQTVTEYRVYCTTEGAYFNTWAQAPPTTCPNNNTHTIDAALTTVVDTVSSSSVVIESKATTGTQGYYQYKGDAFAVDAGAGSTTEHILTFGFPVCVFGIKVNCTGQNVGDSFDMCINPNTVVGVLTDAVNVGDTVLKVSHTVLAYMKLGFNVVLTDGATGQQQQLGAVNAINDAAMTLTVERPVSVACAANSTTVGITVYVARDVYVAAPGVLEVGYGALSAKPIPAGMQCCIVYRNATGGDKIISYIIEHAY